MAVLIVLFISFLASSGILKMITSEWNFILSGNIAMCIMLLFTALGHFRFPKGMAMMIPKIIPYKTELVYLTGFVEIAAGAGLLFPQFRYFTGVFLVAFLSSFYLQIFMPPSTILTTKKVRLMVKGQHICGSGFQCNYFL